MTRVGSALAALFVTAAFTVLESPGQGFEAVPLRPSITPADPRPEVAAVEQPPPSEPVLAQDRAPVRVVLPSPYFR